MGRSCWFLRGQARIRESPLRHAGQSWVVEEIEEECRLVTDLLIGIGKPLLEQREKVFLLVGVLHVLPPLRHGEVADAAKLSQIDFRAIVEVGDDVAARLSFEIETQFFRQRSGRRRNRKMEAGRKGAG